MNIHSLPQPLLVRPKNCVPEPKHTLFSILCALVFYVGILQVLSVNLFHRLLIDLICQSSS